MNGTAPTLREAGLHLADRDGRAVAGSLGDRRRHLVGRDRSVDELGADGAGLAPAEVGHDTDEGPVQGDREGQGGDPDDEAPRVIEARTG